MASKDTSRFGGRGRRQTRSGRVSASDEDDLPEIPTVKRTTRRTSVITVEPKAHIVNGSEDISVHEVHENQVKRPLQSYTMWRWGRHACVMGVGYHFR